MQIEKIITSTELLNLDINDITLLSKEEYKTYRDRIPKTSESWWLRSPGRDDILAACVYGGAGGVYASGVRVDYTLGVRPALKIGGLSSSEIEIGDRFRWSGYTWTIISDKLAQCEDIIGNYPFRKDWRAEDANVYESSDIKKFVEDWFEEQIKKG